ncbi:MAG: regulator [Candidatus Thermoplasmatota archaeon]|nr:regulator [Candidatus Thermoplasmatota archaeon]
MSVPEKRINFWKQIEEKFQKSPSKLETIKTLISLGISVRKEYDEIRFYSGSIEIKSNAISRGTEIDRRVVAEVAGIIVNDPLLSEIFSGIKPIPDLSGIGAKFGFGVIEIIPVEASTPGIIAGVLDVIASSGLNVRQVIVDDPEIVREPRAKIVTDRPVDPALIPSIRNVAGVRAVVIL